MESNNRLVILTTVYNCEKYIIKCLESIRYQKYKNFVCYLLNDVSTDSTTKLIDQFKKETNDSRFVLFSNTKKLRQPGNYDRIIRDESLVSDTDIIVEVDGDDWLPDSDVFTRVSLYYKNQKVWMSYGQFVYQNGRIGFAQPVNFKELRTARFTATHLRTWKPALWKNIKQEDLLINNEYPECAGDLFFMFPMLEMSGPEHAIFVNQINYVYNFDNPLGDSKGSRLVTTNKLAEYARAKKPYQKIENL